MTDEFDAEADLDDASVDDGDDSLDGTEAPPKIPEEPDLATHVSNLHNHLIATESLPLDPRANKWLGEAQALVADLDDNDVTEETTIRRLQKVEHLLEQVDDTGNDAGNTHLARAKERLSAALE